MLKKIIASKYLIHVLMFWGVVGLYYSRSMLSIFLVSVFLLGCLRAGSLKKVLAFRQNKAMLYLVLIFFIYLLSGFNSDNTLMWISRVKTNLPFLLLPIGFYSLGPISKKTFEELLLIFIAITTFSILIIGISYAMHFEEQSKLYLFGKTIPTPILHVRYSFYLALGALFSLYLLLYSEHYPFSIWSPLTYIMIFLVLSVHILAVRSGLLMLYVSGIVIVLDYGLRRGNWKPILGLLFGIILLSLVSYNFMPSVQNKINYMLRDLKSIDKPVENRHNYSDMVRWASIRTAAKVVGEQPLFGTGVGDIEIEMSKKYIEMYPDFPEEVHFNPISQYMFSLTAFGVVGFLFFYYFFFYSLWQTGFKDPFLLLLFSGLSLLFLAESAIELQLGKVMVLSLICIRLSISAYRLQKDKSFLT